MSNLHSSSDVCESPSLDEQNNNGFPFPAGVTDAADYDAWLKGELDDYEAYLRSKAEDAEFEARMIVQDAQSEKPILPVRKVRSTCKGFFDLLDAAGRLCEQVRGATEANKRLRKLNAAS